MATNTTNGSAFGRYAYAANNPISLIDPDGRQAETPSGSTRDPLQEILVRELQRKDFEERKREELRAKSDHFAGVDKGSNLSFTGPKGEVSWTRKWQLRKTSSGGFIIQFVTIYITMISSSGVETSETRVYWEAWEIPAGRKSPFKEMGSDIFSVSSRNNVPHGSATWVAKAAFFDNMQMLPGDFRPNQVREVRGNQLATYKDPGIDWSKGSSPMVVSFGFSW